MASLERSPPPYWTGSPSSPAIRLRWSRLTGSPLRAPSRSTTCSASAPASAQPAAADRGSLAYVRLASKSPLTSRTALPSRMSIAG